MLKMPLAVRRHWEVIRELVRQTDRGVAKPRPEVRP
jgi:hypothetical protein